MNQDIIFSKQWCMPSHHTFEMKPVLAFINRHQNTTGLPSTDPFSGRSMIADIRNDLDPETGCQTNTDALFFLQSLKDNSIGLLYFDPPYSVRQVSECYRKLGLTVNMETTQSSFWTKLKKEVQRVVIPGGKVLSFGWNTQGIGKGLGFKQIEIMIVSHGGPHNDTLCTAEIKL
jgi:hypothetical protein